MAADTVLRHQVVRRSVVQNLFQVSFELLHKVLLTT
jgi:hypothetical protein